MSAPKQAAHTVARNLVRAVNSHEALLAACKTLLRHAEAVAPGGTDYNRWKNCTASEIGECLSAARAAIAKAEGRS